jgi:hypothetical protein
MALSDKDNARRAHAAEPARQITSGETAAFFTTLLAVLNEAAAAPRAGHHEPERPAAEHGLHPAHPADPPPKESAPADPHHGAQHADRTDAAPAESAATVHVDGVATPEPSAATTETTPAGASSATHATTISVPAASPDASADHGSSHEAGAGHSIASAAMIADPAASVLQSTDGINSFVGGSLATVSQGISHVISDVGATIGQLTSSLSATISHLTDSLTGLASTLVHDAPVTAVVEPLLTSILGSTQDAPQPSLDSTSHSIPLLDTAGAIPTALLHPLPLHLGFLGQPTIDGHETHDAAFSALGMHHF